MRCGPKGHRIAGPSGLREGLFGRLLRTIAWITLVIAPILLLLMMQVQFPWIPERSATRLREADLNVLSKLGNQGLEWRLEPEAFTGREVRREDDLLDFLVGYPVDIQVARQPST